MMMAIISEGNKKKTARGDSGPPASIASKYKDKEKDAPESKGKEHHGGKWDHSKKKKSKEDTEDKIEKQEGTGTSTINIYHPDHVKNTVSSIFNELDPQLQMAATGANTHAVNQVRTKVLGYAQLFRDEPHKITPQHIDTLHRHIKEAKNLLVASKPKLIKGFDQFYHNKLGTAVVCVDEDGKILLGKEVGFETWSLPGGHVEQGEGPVEAAKREFKEETGLTAEELVEIAVLKEEVNQKEYLSHIFVCRKHSGKLKDTEEQKNHKYFGLHDINGNHSKIHLRGCSIDAIKAYMNSSQSILKKTSLKYLMAMENLEKNIIRTDGGRGATYEVTHGDALRFVGNGMFRFIKKHVKDMKDEDFKDIKFDTYTISIRKHTNDMYSGRVSDGTKMIHNFTHRSLPMITADLMSVFEWYSEADEKGIESLLSDDLKDDDIRGGIKTLADNYKKHNLANIYEEMNNIRQDIRNGMAVDLQNVEGRMMKLFDKLETATKNISDKHNSLCGSASKEIETLESKLLELQAKIDSMSPKKSIVEAKKHNDIDPNKVYSSEYFYLPKPEITIEPNGRIKIIFNNEWNNFDKENFLNDMKAKIVEQKKK